MSKVAIVTGGNKGIGLAIVEGLSKVFNGDVYLTSRNIERGHAAVQYLSQQQQGGVNNVKYHQLDIDDRDSVLALATHMQQQYGGIDVLINYAAIAFKSAATDPFSHQAEVTLRTNYFNTKATCELLFPLLRSGARVVNLSSSAGFLPRIPGEDLRMKFSTSDTTLSVEQLDDMMKEFIASTLRGDHTEKGWPTSTYCVSKVGLSALSRIQQRDMDKDHSRRDIVVNHCHPGYVDTDMTSHKGTLTPQQGAKSALFAATLPPHTHIKGKYIWSDCSVVDWVNGPRPS